VNDYFGRFDKAWDTSPLQEEQLKAWLDPSGSGLKQAGGYDPYGPNKHFCDTLSALEPGETIILEAYPDPGTGVLTGHNADSITRYAVYLENPGHLNATGLEVHVAGVQASSVQDSVCFYIWAAEEGRPAAVLDSAVYLLEGFLDGMKRFIPLEASLQAAPAFFAGYEIFYATNAPAETQQFALYHSEDRGSGNISWYYHEGQWDPFIHHPLGTRHTALSLTAMVCDELELTTAEKYLHKPGSFRLYPNPATDYVYLETKASPGTRFRLSVYDLAGRIRIKENLICRGNEMRADLRHLSPGLYTLRLESPNSVRYAKLMIRYE